MLGRLSAYALCVMVVVALISPAVFAGPKGRVLCRSLGDINITVDGDFSDWPLGSYDQASVQPLFPGAKNAASTNASGDHLVFDRDRIGLFNGTPDNPLTFADGLDDFDSVIYFAWNQDCLYMLEVRVDDLLRDDRRPGPCPDLDVGNDGFSIFIDAKNDSADCASVVSWPLFDTGAPNADDFELGCNLHNEHRLDVQDPDDVGARQHMERHGTSALIDSPCPGAGSYRRILDALPTADIAARAYVDLGAAGALNPVIVNNPGESFSGYALEVCVPFGFYADFDPLLNPVMGFELFWHETDLCNGSFGCSDAQDDPGTGGNDISWATWAQSTIVDCRTNPGDALFQTTNWGEIVFVGTNPLEVLDCTGVVPRSGEGMTLELITTMSASPTDVAIPPGETGRAMVAHLNGLIQVVDLSDNSKSTYLDLRSRTSTGAFAGAGCLGITFHPRFAQNSYIYVNYTRNSDDHPLISRFTGTNANTELVIVDMGSVPEWGHNGGQLAFGPFDGYLYIAMGDGGPQVGNLGDGLNRSQNPLSLRGKLLRVDVDNPGGGNNYGIPSSNPYVTNGGVLDEIYALGLRNPWRFAFDPLNGDLYLGDIGGEASVPGGSREELDYVAADPVTGIIPGGLNFEWRRREGFKVNDTSQPAGPGTITLPVWDYRRDGGGAFVGSSITGGIVYRGCSMPDLHGTYIFGEWTNGWIASIRMSEAVFSGDAILDSSFQSRTADLNAGLTDSFGNVIAFTVDGEGEVYMLDYSPGRLYKIVSTGPAADTDGDGLSDDDEINVYGTDPALADTDADGLNDGAEVNTHGTDPLVADSDADGLDDGAEVNAHSTNPLVADSDSDGLNDGAEVNSHGTNPVVSDSDADGLSDGAEVNTHNTNPLLADSDADGLSDGAEANSHGTNPLVADSDADGLSDGEEVNTYGTNPLAADSDADGLSDDAEINTHGTDALDADSDADGLSDGEEVNSHNTNPLLADSDTDGLSDGDEVNVHSTDPLDVDTDDGGRGDGDEVLVDSTDPLNGADDAGSSNQQLPGDCNQDGAIDLSDGVAFLQWFFLGVPLPVPAGSEVCLTDPVHATAAGLQIMDWNGDVVLDISDGSGLLTWFFNGAAEHVLGPDCVVIESTECINSCVDSP